MTATDERKRRHPIGRDTVAVVERAFFVLQVVAAAEAALGVREIARRTDLAPATVLRLVRTLESIGMVARRPNGAVVLAPGVDTLRGRGPTSPTADQFVPLLGRLVETFGEAATAAVDDGPETLFLAHVAPAAAVQINDVTGDRWPAHTTASGLVLMGAWSDERLSGYLAGDLAWDAPNAIADPTALRRRVESVRAAGFAWSIEELVAEAAGLAVPIVDEGGRIIAAVGLYAPTYRLHPDIDGMDDLPARLIDLVTRLGTSLSGG